MMINSHITPAINHTASFRYGVSVDNQIAPASS